MLDPKATQICQTCSLESSPSKYPMTTSHTYHNGRYTSHEMDLIAGLTAWPVLDPPSLKSTRPASFSSSVLSFPVSFWWEEPYWAQYSYPRGA